jgi:DNA-binding PadR family transcriptional regulator
MPKPSGCIGKTKLKLLAVLRYNELSTIDSYGYNLWMTLKDKFHLYLEDTDSRNVYHHLTDLTQRGLVEKTTVQQGEKAPNRQLITLTQKGRELAPRYGKYLEILTGDTSEPTK